MQQGAKANSSKAAQCRAEAGREAQQGAEADASKAAQWRRSKELAEGGQGGKAMQSRQQYKKENQDSSVLKEEDTARGS